MTRIDIIKKINDIFCDIFDDETIRINESTSSSDIEAWDSLTHLMLIGSLEDEFGIKFDLQDYIKMKNVGRIVDIILEKSGFVKEA